jgi:hypothetical protein
MDIATMATGEIRALAQEITPGDHGTTQRAQFHRAALRGALEQCTREERRILDQIRDQPARQVGAAWTRIQRRLDQGDDIMTMPTTATPAELAALATYGPQWLTDDGDDGSQADELEYWILEQATRLHVDTTRLDEATVAVDWHDPLAALWNALAGRGTFSPDDETRLNRMSPEVAQAARLVLDQRATPPPSGRRPRGGTAHPHNL